MLQSSLCPLLSFLVCAAAALPAAVTPWNDGWEFQRGEQPTAAWRSLTLPHDWSIEDLPTADLLPEIDAVRGVWRFHDGDDLRWKDPACDDSAWSEHRLPAGWKALRGSAPENSFGWYRRTIPANAACAGKAVLLRMGAIDDADETFLNGVRIGGMGGFPPAYSSAWDAQRTYRVAAGLFKGDGSDVLAVRVYNGGSDGGIHAAGTPRQVVGPFDTVASEGGPATAYMVGGTGWYRRVFTRDASWAGKHVEVRFDGVQRHATVWLNGREITHHAYGYTPFTADLTARLRDGSNELLVRVANTGRNSRWYSGSGIYRPVQLALREDLSIPASGVAVTTSDLAAAAAVVRVAVTVENSRPQTASAAVTVVISGPDGSAVATATAAVPRIPAAGRTVVEVPLTVKDPQRWSLERPLLYRATATVVADGMAADPQGTAFGLRQIEIDAAQGFRLNGVAMKLRGGCIHADNGPLGAVSLERAEERRVALLKERGFNAVRLAHNPPSTAFLEACDRQGLLVLDEAFDMWREAKNDDDYHLDFPSCWQSDIDAMVIRDRNHPSIFAWSVGNEIPERFSARGLLTAKALVGRVRADDPTRPVTQALNGDWNETWEGPVGAALDLVGYNYQLQRYRGDGRKHPQRVIFASESFPLYADEHWYGVLDNPHVIGDFVWTAMDYLGEAGCGFVGPKKGVFYEMQPFPMYTGNCGDLDICGFQRPQSLYRDVLWDLRPAAIVVERPRPAGVGSHPNPWGWPDVEASWNWAGHEGEPLQVSVYAKADRVELFSGETRIGEAAAGRAQHHTATFTVPYAAGTLRARIHGQDTVREVQLATTGPAVRLRLRAERPVITAAPGDLAYVTVEVVDGEGRVVPDAVVPVDVSVEGCGVLRATGNGNSSDAASFTAPTRRTWRGQALVILAPTATGTMTLTARAAGLASEPLVLTVAR